MSEAILKALIRLFAILCRQSGQITSQKLKFVRSYLKRNVSTYEVDNYYSEFIDLLQIEQEIGPEEVLHIKPIDSVEIVAICYQINNTLRQKQRVVVLLHCIELFRDDPPFKPREENLLTCADIFNISRDEFSLIRNFVQHKSQDDFDDNHYLIVGKELPENASYSVKTDIGKSTLVIMKVDSVDLYFIRIIGNELVSLNGNTMLERMIYALPPGSVIKLTENSTMYFADVASRFQEKKSGDKIAFEVKDIELQFPNGNFGIHRMSLLEQEGTMIGILGSSGSGKSTLISVMSGIMKPTNGELKINGLDILNKKAKDQIGFVAQDDLLVEEMTVFQNLYFNSKLVFGKLTENELVEKVEKVLKQLGLFKVRDLKVGSIHEKVLSGGQRKRLNIGLELIRNPAVLFLDEPTSGLSSKDSENVILLLAELRQNGHLLFVVIHQPSSNIYKLFDKVLLMDEGGYCIYQGNPIEAISYFKDIQQKLGKDQTHCKVCGNVNSQELFDIIEEKVVNEFGLESSKRKVEPKEWYSLYKEKVESLLDLHPPELNELPGPSYRRPSRIIQWITYLRRDVTAKLANLQYLLILIIEPLLLGVVLSYVIKRSIGTGDEYIFMKNENLPAYIFISLIVMIFIGLSMSAEEIFRDRKILKREHFLGLSRLSYLFSKVTTLLILSAFQGFVFVWIGNSLLEIHDNLFQYWFMVFSVAFNANLIGLNISGAFKSAVNIYILIPMLIIPQMVLSGAMFNFEKLNKTLEHPGYAPSFVSIIPARWGYEGLMVEQFVNNEYEKKFYAYDKDISKYSYKNGIYITHLYQLVDECLVLLADEKKQPELNQKLHLLGSEINKEINSISAIYHMDPVTIHPEEFDEAKALKIKDILSDISVHYQDQFNLMLFSKDLLIEEIEQRNSGRISVTELRNKYQNQQVELLVKKSFSKVNIVNTDVGLQRLYEPIFMDNETNKGTFQKYPYFSATKYLFGRKLSTYWYNTSIIWLLNVLFFIILYFNLVKIFLNSFNLKRYL